MSMKIRMFMTSGIGVILAGVTALPVQAETIISVSQISYDNVGRPRCQAVRMNPSIYGSLPADACALGAQGANGADRIKRKSYDQAGQVIQVDEAVGTPIQRAYARYTYSNNGLKASEKDANGNLTTLEYDGFDRVKKLRYPSTTVGAGTSSTTDYEEFAYDGNDNKIWHRVRDGRALNFQYDKLNRQITKYASDASIRSVHTNYDVLGYVTSRRFDGTTGPGILYFVNALGEVRSATDMNGRVIWYSYTSAGEVDTMNYANGDYIMNDRDAVNRVTRTRWSVGNATLYTQGYDHFGRLTSVGRGGSNAGGATGYGYDGIGRLTSMTNDLNGAPNDIAWGFGYNPASQLITTTTSSDVYDYEELTGITEPSQAHDGLNRLSTLVGVTANCPSGGYDARGNLICDGAARKYTYDIENRLVSANIGGIPLSLVYDPEGRLSSYNWNGGVTTFVYDGTKLLEEYNSSNQLLRRYVYAPGDDNPVVWFEGSNSATVRYLYKNHQGSVIATADASGNRGDIYTYGAYGEPKDQYGFTYWPTIGTGSTNVSRFGFTGQVFLADARLYYYKARVYDPQLGRFLQTDPVGSKDDLNLYGYVKGDPINGTDPTGMIVEVRASPENKTQYDQAITYLSKDPGFAEDYARLEKSDQVYTIYVSENNPDVYDPENRNIGWDPKAGLKVDDGTQSPALGLRHEIDHAAQHDETGEDARRTASGRRQEERRAVESESETARNLGEPTRRRHTDGEVVEVENSTTSECTNPRSCRGEE